MKTLSEIIKDIRDENEIELTKCEERPRCDKCKKVNWCYLDTYFLTIDYLFKGQY